MKKFIPLILCSFIFCSHSFAEDTPSKTNFREYINPLRDGLCKNKSEIAILSGWTIYSIDHNPNADVNYTSSEFENDFTKRMFKLMNYDTADESTKSNTRFAVFIWNGAIRDMVENIYQYKSEHPKANPDIIEELAWASCNSYFNDMANRLESRQVSNQ